MQSYSFMIKYYICNIAFFSHTVQNILDIFTSPVAQMVKNLPATWETQVQSLGWEDPLEKEMATHSSVPAWKILAGYSS